MSASPLGPVLARLRQVAGPADGPQSDAELLGRFLAGRDEAAFEALVWRHGGMVLNLCHRVLRHDHDAEDAFQAAFLLLARKGHTIGRGSVGAWLHRVAFRVALRVRERQRRLPAPLDAEPPSCKLPATNELRELIDDEVSRLPERYRAAFVLCHLEGRTRDQAARELGCPRGTVDSRVAWALARLRGRLLRRGVAPAVVAGLAAEANAVPPRLVELAMKSVAGTAPAAVVELTHEAMRAMRANRLRTTALLVVAASVFGLGGVGWFAAPSKADAPGAGKPAPFGDGWREVWDLPGPGTELQGLAFSPDGQMLAVGGDYPPQTARAVALFDTRTGRETSRHPVPGAARSLAFAPDGKRLVVATHNQVSNYWLAESGAGWIGLANNGLAADQVAVSPDGRWLVAGWRDGSVELRDLQSGKPVWAVPTAKGGVGVTNTGGRALFDATHHFDLSRDGKVLATGGEYSIRLWDMTAQKITRVLDPKGQTIWVALSPDGKQLAAVTNGAPWLWDLATGKGFRLGDGKLPVVRVVTFSPDGRLLVCGDSNDWTVTPNKLRLFDAKTGQPAGELPGHSSAIRGLTFSSDGRLLASSDANGRVKVWQRGSHPPAAAPPALVAGRLDQLLDQLVKNQRSDAQVIEGLFMAALGRLPTDAEVKRGLDDVARHRDRRDGFAAVLAALTRSDEHAVHLDDLTRRSPRR